MTDPFAPVRAALDTAAQDVTGQLAQAATQIATLQQQVADAQSNTAGQTYQRPSGPGYVRYEDTYRAGDTLQAVMDRAGATNILTFPADEFLLGDFTSPRGYRSTARLTCRGLAGSGPGRTRLRLPAMTSALQSPTSGPPQAKLLDMASSISGAYLGGFTVTAEPVTGANGKPLLFNGFTVSGRDALVEHIEFVAANRGTRNCPPGETGALTTYKAANFTARDVTIDCRDDSGARVATSPFMGNSTDGLTLERVYAHHSYAGTVTFWRCTNIVTRRLRSEHNGGPGGNGNGLNHELCSGSVQHIEPVILAPSGMTMSASSSEASAVIAVSDPVFDGAFTVYSAGSYLGKPEAQQQTDVTVTSGGRPVPLAFHG